MQPALLPSIFGDRHLLGIEGLSAGAITHLLDISEGYVALNREVQKRKSLLGGRTVVLLFFETSTRTRTSFELAGKRLGADVINIAVASSAIKKGETLIDTAMTLNAMHPDMLVVRHPDAGAARLLANHVECGVINAGDGSHEHPTQALLDALTIRRRFGRIEGLRVAICGDVMHSRVARSNILLLNTMGARVRIIAPPTLVPASIERMGVEVFHDMRAGLAGCDVIMMLRLQQERMQGTFVPSTREYFRLLRPRPGQARRGEGGGADPPSGPDEPGRRDRQRSRRRHHAERHPRPGRARRRRAPGLPRSPEPKSRPGAGLLMRRTGRDP